MDKQSRFFPKQLYEVFRKEASITDLARYLGLPYSTVYFRLRGLVSVTSDFIADVVGFYLANTRHSKTEKIPENGNK